MLTLIPEPHTLAEAIHRGHLPALVERAAALILSPAGVEALATLEALDPLTEPEIEPLVSVVSLTQADEAMAENVARSLAEQAGLTLRHPRATAEAIALLGRTDLAADALLCDLPDVRQVAEGHGFATRTMAELQGQDPLGIAPPAPPLQRDHAPTVPLDADTVALLEALLAQGVGADYPGLVRRAVRALAAAMLE